ncbi:MAG: nuclear transport factor 2 family protein [Actinomycetota bacterium]
MKPPADALTALVARYAEIVDTRAFDTFDEVFTDDAELETPNGRRSGRAEIRTAMTGLYRYDRTDHRVGAVAFAAADDGEATGTVECEAHHWSTDADGRRTDRVMTITYHDRYGPTSAGWRIVHRRLEVHRVEELDAE